MSYSPEAIRRAYDEIAEKEDGLEKEHLYERRSAR